VIKRKARPLIADRHLTNVPPALVGKSLILLAAVAAYLLEKLCEYLGIDPL